MLNIFKQNSENDVQDVKTIRDTLLQFIKDQLKKLEGGEGRSIKSMQLFLAPVEDERHMYEAAVYVDEKDKFKNEEVQRIADDYAIELPADWDMEISFVYELPKDAIKIQNLNAAFFVQTPKRSILKAATAYIKVLNGEAEKEIYTITSSIKKVCIGRGKKVQTANGFFRVNDIAFPDDSSHDSNTFISRQHAHIEFNNDNGSFILFADEGGIPPRNKIKVRSANNANPVKIQSTHNGHLLEEGDQIMLGDSALLEFTYLNNEM